MIVTGKGLKDLVLQGKIQAPIEQVMPSHIDVTLSHEVLVEVDNTEPLAKGIDYTPLIDLSKRETVEFEEKETPHLLEPNDFALFQLREWIHLPNDCSAEFFIDSRLARSCLDHTCATWLLPGWEGFLTLELKNLAKYHSLLLTEGMPIGKIVIHKHLLCEEYRGSFNNQTKVRP